MATGGMNTAPTGWVWQMSVRYSEKSKDGELSLKSIT